MVSVLKSIVMLLRVSASIVIMKLEFYSVAVTCRWLKVFVFALSFGVELVKKTVHFAFFNFIKG